MPVIYDATYRPDTTEFAEQFMEHVNQLTLDEFSALRRQANKENVPFPTLVAQYKKDRRKTGA
jgi:hypothetical protein